MNLIWKYNVSASEDKMQAHVAKYFIENGFYHQTGYVAETIQCKVYREITIPTIGRRSDVIVQVTPRKIFNIECKVNDIPGVIVQAIDHLAWANYSYICVHSRTYIPNRDVHLMLKHGIGLLLWQNEWKYEHQNDRPEAFVDVFGAKPSRKIDKVLREKVMKKLIEVDSLQTAQKHEQLTIETE